jgi:hypothetical protein
LLLLANAFFVVCIEIEIRLPKELRRTMQRQRFSSGSELYVWRSCVASN